MLTQKRRKRRRMLRERSPSPPTARSKRRTPSPRLALSTRYSPDDMNSSPNFEEKKKFLTIFNLTHISAEKRKGEAGPGWASGQARQGGRGSLRKQVGPWALGVEVGPRLSWTRTPVSLPPRLSLWDTHMAPPERAFSCVVLGH